MEQALFHSLLWRKLLARLVDCVYYYEHVVNADSNQKEGEEVVDARDKKSFREAD